MKTKLDSNKATNASGSKFLNIFWKSGVTTIRAECCYSNSSHPLTQGANLGALQHKVNPYVL